MSGFDAPEWVVTKDCQSWDCGAARGALLSSHLAMAARANARSEFHSFHILFFFFKQPVADDF